MAGRLRRPGRNRWRGVAIAVAFGATVVVGCGSGSSTSGEIDARSHGVSIRAEGCGPAPRQGAGTMIGGSLVITAAHPVAGARLLEVTDAGGVTRPADIARLDTTLDLAILRVADLDAPTIAIESLTAGETAEFLGRQPDRLVPFSVVRSVDIGFADIYNEGEHRRPGYQLRADVEAGDSGAGLIVDGRLGGLIFASSRTEPERAWATDIAAAAPILDGDAPSPLDSPCVS